jgi:hypothetical protein
MQFELDSLTACAAHHLQAAEAAALVAALREAVAARDDVLALYAAGRTDDARRAHAALPALLTDAVRWPLLCSL